MLTQVAKLGVVLALAAGLSACGKNRDIQLHELNTSQDGPEEFGILPVKALETPEDISQLPAPTPGGRNRTDQTPVADAVAALGGNPNRVEPRGEGVSRSDGSLVNYASRKGVTPGIRQKLAAEDLEFRKRQSLFTWSIKKEDKYYDAYRKMAIDPYYVLRLYRNAGARTPAALPPGVE
jgi:hypothetical protein